MTRVITAIVIAVVVAGYGMSALTGATPSPDDPVVAPATDDGSDGRRYELREPEEGLVDVYARPFDRHRKDGRRVVLFYVSGVDECYGLDRIKVQERRRKVILTIFEGHHPEAEECPDLGVYVKSIAHLERPVGKRKVVDGAR